MVAAEPALADAHHLAPRCAPVPPPAPPGGPAPDGPTTAPAELPPAADGTDVAACADGTCQILVTGPVDITVSGKLLEIALDDENSVIVGAPGSNGAYSRATVGPGAGTTIGSADGVTVSVTVLGRTAEGAVLDIAPS